MQFRITVIDMPSIDRITAAQILSILLIIFFQVIEVNLLPRFMQELPKLLSIPR